MEPEIDRWSREFTRGFQRNPNEMKTRVDVIESGRISDANLKRVLAADIGWEPLLIDKETAKRGIVWILLSLGVVLGIFSAWVSVNGGG